MRYYIAITKPLLALAFIRKAIPNMTSDAGKIVQALAWKEIITELRSKVQSFQEFDFV